MVGGDTLPRLDIGAVHAVDALDIFEGDIDVVIGHIRILAHRANSYTITTVTSNISDKQISSVPLGSDTVVSISDKCVLNEQSITIPGVIAIGIGGIPLIITRSIDKKVCYRDILALPDKCRPELWLDDRQMVCQEIRRIEESDTDWTSRLIGTIPVFCVPRLSVSVVPASLTAQSDVGTAEKPRCRLILQNNRVGVGAPVGYIVREAKLAAEQDFAVDEVGGV